MGATKLRRFQILVSEFIKNAASVDWTKDDITASAKAIADLVADSGIKVIEQSFSLWSKEPGVYIVKPLVSIAYGRGNFSLGVYGLLVLLKDNSSNSEERRHYIILCGDGSIMYGESWESRYGTLTTKTLNSLKNMSGASANAAGSAGFAPAPAAGDDTKFLRGDGIWSHINYVKIYHMDQYMSVDGTIEEIIESYKDGYYVALEVDEHIIIPLYDFVDNTLYKKVCFGLTTFSNRNSNFFGTIHNYYYWGESQNGSDTWQTNVASDERFDGGNPFIPASVSLAGKIGLVPAPPVGSGMMVLRGDCSWANITMYLETVAVGRQQSGLYRYTLEYNSQIISYNEIYSAFQKGVPIVVHNGSSLGGLWFLDIQYDSTQQKDFITFRKVAVFQNQLQCRKLKYTVVDNTEYWDEVIEYTTT